MADEPITPALAQEQDTPTPDPAAVATPDTPTQDAPDSQDSPQINYEQRYTQLRSEFDRRNELLADIEGRRGPEAQAQALAQYAQIELESDDPEPELEDEFDIPDPSAEVAQIRQELAERDEVAQAAEFDRLEAEYIERTVEGLEAQDNLKLSDDEYQIVVNHGLANRDPHDGKPDLEGGFNALKAAQEAARNRYAASKDSAALAPVGATGESKIDLRDKEARQKLATEVFEAAERQKNN